jgi:hypothetical protein
LNYAKTGKKRSFQHSSFASGIENLHPGNESLASPINCLPEMFNRIFKQSSVGKTSFSVSPAA